MADQAAKRHSSTSREIGTSSDPVLVPNPDIFSDDFALEPLEVQGAFTPSSPAQDAASPTSSFDIPHMLGITRRTSTSAQELPRRNRNSLSQSISRGFLSRRERPSSQNYATSIVSASDIPKTASVPPRSMSTVSNSSMPRAQSPYQGATGPSHPYGMYSQDTQIVRNPSSATNSTVRMPERSYAGFNEPTQPYGLYSQNIALEDQLNLGSNMVRSVPGFPRQEQNYRRRYEHDGEEAADIIGPDGYTEQLPPYSRYANDIPPKNETSGMGMIDDEPRDQSGSSQNTLSFTQSRNIIAGTSVAENSSTQLNPSAGQTAVSTTGGGYFKERVKAKGKKRICFGKIPMWILMVFLLVAATLLGAVIGGILGRAAKKSSDDDPTKPVEEYAPVSTIFAATTVTTTSLVDAVPITSTTNLPSLPTGLYQMGLNELYSKKNDCLEVDYQKMAWDCNTEAIMDIQVNGSDLSQLQVSFSYYDDQENSQGTLPRYGPQPPGFSGFANMTIMIAKGDEGKGPAYVFHHEFDKLVILHENVFNRTSLKRWLSDEDYRGKNSLDKRHDTDDGHVGSEDKPWYCFWNGTVLEGFIFATKDLANSSTALVNSAFQSIPFNRNETTSLVLTRSPEIPVPTSPLFPTRFSWAPGIASFSEPDAAISTSRPWKKRQQVVPAAPENPGPSLIPYPKVIKIEERRNFQNGVQPYCQQMGFNGGITPLPIDNRYITMDEHEEVRAMTGGHSRRRSWSGIFGFKRSADEWSSSCGCVWISR